MKKSAQRDANTARALAVVTFGHRPPARCKHQSHRQDRLQYTALLSLAHSVTNSKMTNKMNTRTHTNTHAHSVLTAILPGEPGLASCPLDSPAPFIPIGTGINFPCYP